MTSDADDTLMPVGPGIDSLPTTASDCPRFEDDPGAWFGWLDAAVAGAWPRDTAFRPASWSDGSGHAWRVVLAPGGPEVRPALGLPSFVVHDLPVITALLVAHDRIHVELTWHTGREVVHLELGQVQLIDLGLAMLTGTELPHDSIVRVLPDTWERARRRWYGLRTTSGAPVS